MKVTIIGAGLAGLTAGWRLREAGYDVTILEAAAKSGGRMADASAGDIQFNAGARLIYNFGGDLFALLRDLNLTTALIPINNLSALCAIDGTDQRLALMPTLSTMRMPGLTIADRLRLLRLALTMRKSGSPDDLLTAARYDSETLASWADRNLGPRLRARLIDPIFRGTRAWNAEDISPAFLLATLPHMLGQRTVYTLQGGMGRLTRELAARLGVRQARRVTSVKSADQCCETTLEDGTTLQSDLAILAVPQPLPLLATPTPEQATFLPNVRYNRLAILHLALSGDLPPTMRFITTSPTLATYQQLQAKGRPHAQLYCQLTPEASLSDAPILPRLLPELRHFLPDIDTRILANHEQRIAHKLPTPYPGYLAHLARYRAWQDSTPTRVLLAGDYLTAPLLGGAAHSGAIAASQIARHWPLQAAPKMVA